MIRSISRAACLIWGLSFAAPLCAQVQQELSYEYYPVVIKEEQSLARAIYTQSPLSEMRDGKPYYVTGRANWRISYKYDVERPSMDVCRIKTYQVGSRCKITFPDLKNGDEHSRHLFYVFMGYLRDHEGTHCKIAENYANALHAQLGKARAMDCAELGPYIKREYERIFEECKAAQNQYDAAVTSGKKNGLPLGIAQLEKRFKEWEKELQAAKGTGNLETLDSSQHGFTKGADGVWRNY